MTIEEELESINIKIKDTRIALGDASSNSHWKTIPSQDAVVAAMLVPNSLYCLWQRRREIESQLGEQITAFSAMANLSLSNVIKLNISSDGLENRLQNEASRFRNKYKKAGGAMRKKLLNKTTNILLFTDNTVPHENEINGGEQSQIHGKDYQDLGDRQKQRRKQQIKKAVNSSLNSFKEIGLAPVSLELRSTDRSDDESFTIMLDGSKCTKNSHNDQHHDAIPSLAYLLLKYGVSQKFYHELSMSIPELPRSYKVKQFKNDCKETVPTIRTFKGPMDTEAVYFDFTEILKAQITAVLMKHPDKDFSEFIKVKISGDGAKYSRTSNFILLSFTILIGEQKEDLSSNNVVTFAALKGKENYKGVADGFSECFKQLNEYLSMSHPVIEIEDVIYNLKFFLCCDYKFTLLLLGLNAAHSNFACAWCQINKTNRHNMRLEESKRRKRTLETLKDGTEPGSINPPLLHIALDHIVPDELHLMLRVTDKLIENLINGAIAHDSPKKPLEGEMVQNLIQEIESCGVQFSIWEKATKYEFTSLTGTDRKKLLKELPAKLIRCQPSAYASKVKLLWENFADLYSYISSYSKLPETMDIGKMAKNWINEFLQLGTCCDGYQKSNVTPYMHIMAFHIPTFIEKHGNIKQFSCQAVEKNNDVAKMLYFRNSNKRNAEKDILTNQYILDALQSTYDSTRESRDYRKRKTDDGLATHAKKTRLT